MTSASSTSSALKPAALALALGLALAGVAIAQTAPTPAQQKELDTARADLHQAAQRVAELHRKYGGAEAPMRIEKRVLRKPVIGVLLAPDAGTGVRIAGVTPDSAAAAAGLKSGDRLLSIDGKVITAADGAARVEHARDLLSAVDTRTAVRLAYERDGKAAVVSVTPKLGDRLLLMPGEDGAALMGDSPGDVRREIIRLGSDCRGEDCKLPALAEAFRWNGLNLASVDAQLGRYFGTSEGVLVLSTGKDLAGLQAGDVIRKIGGKPVDTPRAAMEALRAQPDDARVAVEYLRDRAVSTAQVSVPKALPFNLTMAPHASLPRIAAFTAVAPHAPGAVEKRRFVLVDKDGKTQRWEGDAGDTPPAWVQALPKDGQRVEKRKVVMIDKDGKTTVIEDDELPQPAPPVPPKRD